MARKAIGFTQNSDQSWTVVFSSRETRDGLRSVTLPAEAEVVLREHYSPTPAHTNPPRKTAVIEALRKKPDGMTLGSLVNAALEALGEDSEDMLLRKRMCGVINTIVDEGVATREKVDGREIIKLVK